MTVDVLAADTTIGNPVANIGIFVLFVAITLYIVICASRKNTTAAEFFTAGRVFTGPQNGIAIYADHGLLQSVGFLLAWLVPLPLAGEVPHNAGKFPMADAQGLRRQQRPVQL